LIDDIIFDWDFELGWVATCRFRDGEFMAFQLQGVPHYTLNDDLISEIVWRIEKLGYRISKSINVLVK
jgi:hypothetical protein